MIFRKIMLAAFMSISSAALPTAAATAAAIDADYRLGAGDLLKVNVAGYVDLSAEVRVSQTGGISYPFVGQLAVEGLSTTQLEELLARKLAEGKIVREPQVNVLVLEYQSKKVSVLGQVIKPGQFSLNAPRKVLDMLAEAGGLNTQTASDDAILLRGDGEKITIDLFKLFNGDSEQNLAVAAGDAIVVRRAPQFYIYGAVQKPGIYRLERNMSVSQAISAGGGLTAHGSQRRIVVKRKDGAGRESVKRISAAEPVLADDVVMVKETVF